MEQLARSTRPLALRHGICGSFPQRKGMQNNDRIHRRYKGYIAPPGGQAHPVQGFYAELLKKLKIKKQPPPPPPPEAQPREPVPLPRKKTEETWERAQKVFGSRDKAAVERRKQWQASTQNIAGVMVPPRPTEPDNCCMSGCVNCVWDMYRDEMEEWAAKSAEARARMQAQNKDKQDGAKALAARDIPSLATSMDDDGGGSETNWVPSESKVDLFEDIPVGIREFMRTEKALKQKHRAEQTPSAP